MARPGWPERNRAARSFRQLRRFHHVINSDKVFGTHNRILSFKPQLRLEWRGQDRQNETEQPDHSANLGDSITSSTRIRFSVHTAASDSCCPLLYFRRETYSADVRLRVSLSTVLRRGTPDSG